MLQKVILVVSILNRPPPRYTVTYAQESARVADLSVFRLGNQGNSACSQSNPFYARLLSNDRVTSEDHFQDVRLVRLDIHGSNIRYTTISPRHGV